MRSSSEHLFLRLDKCTIRGVQKRPKKMCVQIDPKSSSMLVLDFASEAAAKAFRSF